MLLTIIYYKCNISIKRNQCFFHDQSDGSDVYGKRSYRYVCENDRVSGPAGGILPDYAAAGFCAGQFRGKEAALCRVWGLMSYLREAIF